MYKSIAHFIDRQENWQSKIRVKKWDDELQDDVFIIEEIYPRLYAEDRRGHYNSFFNTKVTKMEFPNVIKRSQWIKEHSGQKIYGSYTPERQYLLDNFYHDSKDLTNFTAQPLKIQYVDIEIQIKDEFPSPEQAKYPINVMTIYDSEDKHYYIWIAQEGYTPPKNTKDRTYFHFDNDYELIPHFLEWFKCNRPDIITGWNTKKFDLPYIVNRCYIMEDEEYVNKCLSPIGEVRKRYEDIRGGQGISTYDIVGCPNLDYMILYKNKFGPPSKPSYSLDATCQDELGLGKLEYEGSIKEFMEGDFDRFVEYNIVDVERVVQLDERLQYITLARYLCNMGLIEYDAIFKSMPLMVGVMAVECLDNGKIMITHSGKEAGEEGFEGAYVKKPISGIYTEGIYSLDLNSLYPNIMMAINISPEKKVGKIIEESDEAVTVKIGNTIKKMSREKYTEKVLSKCVVSGNGVLFERPNTSDDYGIMPKFLETLYANRRTTKDNMLDLKRAKKKLTDEQEIYDMDTKIAQQDKIQWSFKILLNSLYGVLGSKYFPLFDIDLASSVTSTGRIIIQGAGDYVDANNLGTTVAGDTDSIYVECSKIFNAYCKKKGISTDLPYEQLWSDEFVQDFCKVIDDKIVPKVNNFCSDLMLEKFNSPRGDRIEFKREKLSSSGMFFAKKRYMLHARDDEGVPVNKFAYVGVDVKKNELPKLIKGELAELLESYLMTQFSYTEYEEKINAIWNKYTDMTIDQIAYIKGYNTPKAIEGFLKSEKGSGAHVRAAHYHTQLLEKMNVKAKYEPIKVGDKLRFVYLKTSNKYNIDVIGYKDKYPTEFENLFTINHKKMFNKTVLKPLSGFEKLLHWSTPNPSIKVALDIMKL